MAALEHAELVEREVEQLGVEIVRLGTQQSDGTTQVTFGV